MITLAMSIGAVLGVAFTVCAFALLAVIDEE